MRYLIITASIAALAVVGCNPIKPTGNNSAPTVAGNPKEPERKTYTREELEKMVAGKTINQVIEMLGKPSSTEGNSNGYLSMRYKEISRDAITGKKDDAVHVTFSNGQCDGVHFF